MDTAEVTDLDVGPDADNLFNDPNLLDGTGNNDFYKHLNTKEQK